MQSPLFDLGEAAFSPDHVHRYWLTRSWGEGPGIAWLMLNPSTATAAQDDPTIRKCIGFSRRWGYGRLVIVNLFALRSTDPRALAKHAEPVGLSNDEYILRAARECTSVMCAWGCRQHLSTPTLSARPGQVVRMVQGSVPLYCIGYRKDGAPRHPLMVAYETKREPFELR